MLKSRRTITLALASVTMVATTCVALAATPKPAPKVEAAKKIQVEMLLAKGQDALTRDQNQKAVLAFQEALALDTSNDFAKRQLVIARQLNASSASADTLAMPADNGSVLSDYEKQRRIAKQLAVHDVNEAMRRSMELMAKPDTTDAFNQATQAAKVAKNILQNKKRLFTTSEFRDRMAKIEDQITWIETKRDTWQQLRVKSEYDEVQRTDLDRIRKNKVAREQKISELTSRARELRHDRQWPQALRVMEQVIELDPDNAWASDNIYMIKRFLSLKRASDMTTLREEETAKLSGSIRNSEIPWYNRIRYPRDWKDLTKRRERYAATVGAESEENIKVRRRLETRVGDVPLVSVTFEEAIEWLRTISGANIEVNWGTIEVDAPDIRQAEITVQLKEVPVRRVMESILKAAGGGVVQLGYVINDGVVTITTITDLNQNVYPQVYDVRDLLVRVPDFVAPSTRIDLGSGSGQTDEYGDSTGSGGADTASGGLFDSDADESSLTPDETREDIIKKITDLIQTTVGNREEDWYPNGPGQIASMGGNLIISQTAKNHQLVQHIISKLRETQTIQVSVEARFLTVTTGFLNQIGVDLDIYFNTQSDIAGPRPTAGGMASGTTDPYTGAAVPFNGPSTWRQAGHSGNPSVSNMSPTGMTQNSNTFANLIGVGQGIGGKISAPAMSIAGTFLDDVQVDLLIEATQAHSGSRLMTAPRLTLMNGQRAYVAVGTLVSYVAGYEPVVSDNVGVARPIIEDAMTGAVLDVDVTVSHDRRYVTMTVRPQVSRLNNGGIIEVDDNWGVGLPNRTVQEVKTTVSIPDGGTLLVGGHKFSQEEQREMGVPVISKVPVINRMFTNKTKERNESTLLILIKPEILINDELEQRTELHQETPAHY